MSSDREARLLRRELIKDRNRALNTRLTEPVVSSSRLAAKEAELVEAHTRLRRMDRELEGLRQENESRKLRGSSLHSQLQSKETELIRYRSSVGSFNTQFANFAALLDEAHEVFQRSAWSGEENKQ